MLPSSRKSLANYCSVAGEEQWGVKLGTRSLKEGGLSAPLTIGTAPGPRSPGRCPLQVSLDSGPAQPPVPVQGVQDVTDQVHQVSHMALALGQKLWSTGVIRGGRGSGGYTAVAPTQGCLSPGAPRTGLVWEGRGWLLLLPLLCLRPHCACACECAGSTWHPAKLGSDLSSPIFQLCNGRGE